MKSVFLKSGLFVVGALLLIGEANAQRAPRKRGTHLQPARKPASRPIIISLPDMILLVIFLSRWIPQGLVIQQFVNHFAMITLTIKAV